MTSRQPTADRRQCRWVVTLVALLLPFAAGAAAPPPTPQPLPEGVPPFEVATSSPTSWYGRFGWTNVAWIDMGDGVLLVDTGASAAEAENIRAQIKEKTKGKAIRWIVLTHPHADSNGAIVSYLPTDATIFMNDRAVGPLAPRLMSKDKGGRVPTIVGVRDRITVASGTNAVELVAAAGAAHTGEDLVAFHRGTAIAYVGDLVTPNRCPMTSDAGSDPRGWYAALDDIALLKPGVLVPSRGDATNQVENELTKTRSYLKRVMDLLSDFKKSGHPEARVAAELLTRKLGDYCPVALDNVNTLSLYKRTDASGVVKPPARPAAAAGKKG